MKGLSSIDEDDVLFITEKFRTDNNLIDSIFLKQLREKT